MNRYTVSESHATQTAAKNLLVLTAPSTHYVTITHASVTNPVNATGDQIAVAFYRATAAGTGAPTAVTPQPCELGYATASSVTVEHTYATTEPTLHTEAHYPAGFDTVRGWEWSSQNGMALVIPPSGILVLRQTEGTITSVTLVAEITWREMLSADYKLEVQYS